jgi:hypothetical protein
LGPAPGRRAARHWIGLLHTLRAHRHPAAGTEEGEGGGSPTAKRVKIAEPTRSAKPARSVKPTRPAKPAKLAKPAKQLMQLVWTHERLVGLSGAAVLDAALVEPEESRPASEHAAFWRTVLAPPWGPARLRALAEKLKTQPAFAALQDLLGNAASADSKLLAGLKKLRQSKEVRAGRAGRAGPATLGPGSLACATSAGLRNFSWGP